MLIDQEPYAYIEVVRQANVWRAVIQGSPKDPPRVARVGESCLTLCHPSSFIARIPNLTYQYRFANTFLRFPIFHSQILSSDCKYTIG